jgi:hypothetical protein
MHRLAQQIGATRHSSQGWNAVVCLLILLHGLLPTLHAVSCVEHVCRDSVASHGELHLGATEADGDHHANVEHECSVCRVLTHFSVLQNPAEQPLGFASASDPVVADAPEHIPAWAPLRDDLGRAPPTTLLWS